MLRVNETGKPVSNNIVRPPARAILILRVLVIFRILLLNKSLIFHSQIYLQLPDRAS